MTEISLLPIGLSPKNPRFDVKKLIGNISNIFPITTIVTGRFVQIGSFQGEDLYIAKGSKANTIIDVMKLTVLLCVSPYHPSGNLIVLCSVLGTKSGGV